MKICVIGGGAAGLSSAYTLSKAGHEVTVFEADSETGGLVKAIPIGSDLLESYYHHIFTSDTEIIRLIDELGLSDHLMWLEPKNGMYINSKLYPFTSPMDLMRFSELSLIDRLKMGLLVPRAQLIKDWKPLEAMTTSQWIEKNAGKQVYKKVWKPLMVSKFDNDSDNISAVWIWNKFKLRGTSRGKNISKELLGYMKGSFTIVYDTMIERIKHNGGRVMCSAPVNKLSLLSDGTFDVYYNERKENFHKVLAAVSPDILKGMINPLLISYINSLEKVKYKANICMLMETSESLSDYYWITVAESNAPFVLVIEHTNLVKSSSYGSHIVYLSRYIDDSSEFFSLSDEDIRRSFVSYLKSMFPHWNEKSIINTHISRTRYAQPVVCKHYSSVIPNIKTPVHNLYLASMAQIYPEDRGQNYSLALGQKAARLILEDSVQ